ncbi:oligoendopeptidase F [Ruminiclostridium papyrosolvens DSM 2782]|uniref:Oligopeptidase F n=1 Tax=Ruminiclostridium papyrosolvens DSM 2782 TaxID=588581 RepID=F1TFF5_9FIRM|nr:oligoendopeptidase F [Ruminiclostridium papyrosolvens]EGD46879.1 oligoendopeptidase F [Ruminiclostridium papyrosolvens DSM 2782]WES34362.1 oligoendopeptidase F [Ruminiclostridium papyrosolvens DSM 2782]
MASGKTLPKRKDIEDRFKWKLEDIYKDTDSWEKDFKAVKDLAAQMGNFQGKLGNSADTLLDCFKKSDELLSLNDKVFVYARMKRDEDNGNSTYQALTDRASTLGTEVYTAISFIIPEMLAIPEDKLLSFINSNKELSLYMFMVQENLRQKEHILSEKEEQILALSTEISDTAGDIFTMYNNADIKFPHIRDEKGEDVEVTKGRYSTMLESRDRRVRKDAFEAVYGTYDKMKNTLGASLTGNVKKNRFYSVVRKYPSSLEASLDNDNVSVEVYDNLIETVNKNLHLLDRYLKLRKKVLKLDELHMYDLYVPMVEEYDKKVTYEEGKKLVEEGLKPLGEEYIGYLKNGFDSGWVDIYENQGKTSGAYSWGAFKTHPYVLLNYQDNINDVYTLAHEMGHALHSYYTNMTQPYVYSQYKIFVAEVASTVNESLLMRYMLSKSESKQEKAYLLNHYLEEFRGTVFRQTMFAEFEKLIHQKTEQGEALNAQELCDIYYSLNKKYFGEAVNVDKEIAMEWSRIPHFYSSFYVYKYATGFSAATAIAEKIYKEGKPAVDKYLEFLKGGGSNYPIELLKIAGVDLSSPQPIQDALNVFEKTLEELEQLLV